MFVPALAALAGLALGLTQPKPAEVVGAPLAPQSPVQLSFSLQLTHPSEMAQLRAAQLDPKSPSYHHWLTPEQFGQQFGQPVAFVTRTAAWLRAAGFEVKIYKNNSFLEAVGTAAEVRSLLGVRLNSLQGAAASVHVPNRAPELPSWLAPQVVYVGGLDTRVRAHHRLYDSSGNNSFGPQDLRALYDVAIPHYLGFYGQGQQLVVLAWAEAPGSEVLPADIAYFYQNVSDANVTFVQNNLPNPTGDFDNTSGGRQEFELDVEAQSIGSPGAQSITLDNSPASAIFTIGAQDIANNFPNATAVSTSIGICETAEKSSAPGEAATMEAAVIQGTMEGQTWSAAAGDDGADDCRTGGAGPISVDFPGVLPEVISMGGTQVTPPALVFDADNALTGYEVEGVWNDSLLDGGGTGAGGGGISTLFPAPTFQAGLMADGGNFSGRSVPDLALIAGQPGTITVATAPGVFDSFDGTSIASPLSAGFFGLVASALGCRLGDPHALIYQLGKLQQQNQFGAGFNPFNDITSGNNGLNGLVGFSAAPGYDSASGWGSIDVYNFVLALQGMGVCPLPENAPLPDAGANAPQWPIVDAGPSYDQCTFINCIGSGQNCVTIGGFDPNTSYFAGPSACNPVACNPAFDDAGVDQCALNSFCSPQGPYAGDGDGGGACAGGCFASSDCSDGGSCNACYSSCDAPGNPTAQIGSPCTVDSDCPTGGNCVTTSQGVGFDGGYCMANCNPFSDACATLCGPGGSCQPFGNNFYTCLETCNTNSDCTRPGYLCQPQSNYCGDAGSVFSNPAGGQPCPSVCEPGCALVDAGGVVQYNTCLNPWAACDPTTGACIIVDGGGAIIATGTTTSGTTGGATTTGSATTTGTTGGATTTSGASTGGTGVAGTASATATGTTGVATATAAGTSSGTGGTGSSGSTSGGTGTSSGSTGASTGTSTGTSTGAHAGTTTSAQTTGHGSGAATSSGGSTGGVAGTSTGGTANTGTTGTTSSTSGTPSSGGCGCSPGGEGSPDLVFGLFALVGLVRRRRRAARPESVRPTLPRLTAGGWARGTRLPRWRCVAAGAAACLDVSPRRERQVPGPRR